MERYPFFFIVKFYFFRYNQEGGNMEEKIKNYKILVKEIEKEIMYKRENLQRIKEELSVLEESKIRYLNEIKKVFQNSKKEDFNDLKQLIKK